MLTADLLFLFSAPNKYLFSIQNSGSKRNNTRSNMLAERPSITAAPFPAAYTMTTRKRFIKVSN
jgi:hypothetical protein